MFWNDEVVIFDCYNYLQLRWQDDIGSPLMCKDQSGVWYATGMLQNYYLCIVPSEMTKRQKLTNHEYKKCLQYQQNVPTCS